MKDKSLITYILEENFDVLLEKFKEIKRVYARLVLTDGSPDANLAQYTKNQIRLQVIKEIDTAIESLVAEAKKGISKSATKETDSISSKLTDKIKEFKNILQ